MELDGKMNVDDALWVEKLSDMLERQHASLQQVPVRTKVAAQIIGTLQAIARDMQRGCCDADAACKLLTTTKVMMRDRRGIQELLSVETLELFLSLAECADTAVAEDALKCVINSVYSRPEFVRDHALPQAYYASRLLQLSTRAAPATFHWVVWKALLVSCEADEMIHALAYNLDTWTHIHTTLHFCLHGGSTLAFPSGQGRMDLFMELVKLVAVLVNDLKLSPPRLDAVELLVTLQPLGEVLLQALQYAPPHMSPFDTQLIDLKNKVVEIFLFIPTPLLGFFVQQQQDALSAIMGHLYSMLVLVRIEKTRLAKDLQPVLMACHHLTSTGDPAIRAFFKAHIFPSEELQQPRKPAPPAFFHKHLTCFLTSLDTTVKRCMGEWLYLLCDQNADEYTRRTGLGNAIGLLRIKGLA